MKKIITTQIFCFFVVCLFGQEKMWVDYQKTYHAFISGEKDQSKVVRVSTSGKETPLKLVNYSFDGNGNQKSTTLQWESNTNSWQPILFTFYLIDFENQYKIEQKWNGFAWVNSTRIFKKIERGEKVKVINHWNLNRNRWEDISTEKDWKNGKRIVTNNSETIYQEFIKGIWKNFRKIKNVEKNNNEQIKYIYKWESNKIWLNSRKEITLKSGNEKTIQVQGWNEVTHKWMNNSKDVYRSKNGHVVERVTKKWNAVEAKWENEKRELVSYENDRRTKEIIQLWKLSPKKEKTEIVNTQEIEQAIAQKKQLAVSGNLITCLLPNPYVEGDQIIFNNLKHSKTYQLLVYNSIGDLVSSDKIKDATAYSTRISNVEIGWHTILLLYEGTLVLNKNIIVVE